LPRSQVEILPDLWTEGSPLDDAVVTSASTERFSLVSTISALDSTNTYYGGVDTSFPENEDDPAIAVYTILNASDHSVVYTGSELFSLTVPYVSSFLAFREIDPLVRLVEQQRKVKPEVTPRAILCDGNGVWHERMAGIATCLGVKTGIPTLGVGKSVYCCGGWTPKTVEQIISTSLATAVEFQQKSQLAKRANDDVKILCDLRVVRPADFLEAGTENKKYDDRTLTDKLSKYCSGLAVPLGATVENGTVRMCALVAHAGRMKPFQASKNAIFISPGHRISLQDAVSIAAYLSLARIPEPVRKADLLGRDLLRQKQKEKSPNKG